MMHYSGGIYPLSKCYFIGLTATPWRTKYKEGFCEFFQALIRAPDPIKLVKMGYLSRPRLFGIIYSQFWTTVKGEYLAKSE